MIRLRVLPSLILSIVSILPAALAQPAVVIDDDFRLGDRGWVGFFADHPPGVDADWDFETGLRPLPAELGVSGTGFLLAGDNHSDDLAMLMKKPLGPADGLVPNQAYRVSFVIEFASNAASGSFGVGGSPGDSVYLKAGATTGEPGAALNPSPDLHYRPTVNVGYQSLGGPAASIAGVIANGRSADQPATYVTLTREHLHPFPIHTDAAGRLWLLVMTDSAFEGPTALYYQRIRVILTPVVTGGAARLTNLAGRAPVEPGEDALVAGVAVAAPGARLLIRGVGPGLAAHGIARPLPNPVLRLHAAGGAVLAANDNWSDAPDPGAIASAAAATGAFPLAAGSADSALLVDVPAGTFTAVVTDVQGGSGVGLVEIYEVVGNGAGGGRLLNLATRAPLGRDDDGLFPGLVVQGPNPERFLVRAIGPRLADFGVIRPATDPVLFLYRGDTLLAVNEDWELVNDAAEVTAAGVAAGAFPITAGSRDAAMVVTLDPGVYTLQAVEAGAGDTGIGLVEVYRLP